MHDPHHQHHDLTANCLAASSLSFAPPHFVRSLQLSIPSTAFACNFDPSYRMSLLTTPQHSGKFVCMTQDFGFSDKFGISTFGQHFPKHNLPQLSINYLMRSSESPNAKFRDNFIEIYPSQRHNLPLSLEIITITIPKTSFFPKFSNFSKKSNIFKS